MLIVAVVVNVVVCGSWLSLMFVVVFVCVVVVCCCLLLFVVVCRSLVVGVVGVVCT